MYEYKLLSQEDKIKIVQERILYMENNLYSLSISKIEAEARQDSKGLIAIEEEEQKSLAFLAQLNSLLDALD